jgi:hypothetical protein
MREIIIGATAILAVIAVIFATDPAGDGSGTPQGTMIGLGFAAVLLIGVALIWRM